MTIYYPAALKKYVGAYSGLSKSCWGGIILNFVESTLIGIYYFLPLYFVNKLNIDIATASIIISFYGVGAIIGGFVGGQLSDKISPGSVTIVSLFFQALVFLALTKLTSVNLLIINLFFMGIASYSFLTSNNLWIINQCGDNEKNKFKAINIIGAASNLGLGLSAIIISSLVNYGFQYIFISCGILLILAAVYFYLIDKNVTRQHAAPKITTVRDIVKNHLPVMTDNRKIINLVLFCVFLVGLIIFQLSTTYSIYIQNTFPIWGIKGVGILFALNSFMVVFFQVPVSNFFDTYNKILMLGVGAFLLGMGMFLLCFAFTFEIAVLACVIFTIGEMLFFSVAVFLCFQKAAENKKGQALGVYRMVYASSRIVGPAAGGVVYQSWGANILWVMCGAIGFVCLLACRYYKKLL